MKQIIINNIDLMTKEEERKLIECLEDLYIDFEFNKVIKIKR
jgi:hypothetical protein